MENSLESQAPLVTLDTASILADPKAYQFRHGGDERGVVASHEIHRSEWDAKKYKPIMVHERSDGRVFVVDGHHRLAHAQKLLSEGKEPAQLTVRMLSEKQGVSIQDAKVIAAFDNIARGDTNPIEAAMVFKEADKMEHQEWLPSLKLNTEPLQIAYRLSYLGDRPLARVAAGEVPLEFAAKVADKTKDEAVQERAIMHLSAQLKQGYPAVPYHAELASALNTRMNDNGKSFVEAEMKRRAQAAHEIGMAT